MNDASNYTENNVINAALRGVAYPLPTATYVSLHTGDPGETGTANEVTVGAWPSYVRRHAEQGGAIGTGWIAPTDGVTSNAKQLTYPNNNGAAPVVVTHIAVWDALSGGNAITKAALTTPRTIDLGEVLVFDIGALVVAQT